MEQEAWQIRTTAVGRSVPQGCLIGRGDFAEIARFFFVIPANAEIQ